MKSLYKTDRSHSEVGDTLRYFNSVSTSKSWCGGGGGVSGFGDGGGHDLCCSGGGGGSEHYFGGGEDDGSLVALSISEDASSLGSDNLGGHGRIRRGGKGKSGSAQVLSLSKPAGAARFNSVVGCYQVDRICNDIVFCEASDATRSIGRSSICSAKRRAFNLQRGSLCGGTNQGGGVVFSPPANARVIVSAPQSHKGSKSNSRERISIILHPPEEEVEEEEEEEEEEPGPVQPTGVLGLDNRRTDSDSKKLRTVKKRVKLPFERNEQTSPSDEEGQPFLVDTKGLRASVMPHLPAQSPNIFHDFEGSSNDNMRRPSVIILHNCNCNDKDADRAGVLRRQSNGCGRGVASDGEAAASPSPEEEEEEEEEEEGKEDEDEDEAASVHEVAATVMLPGHMLAALKPKSIIEKEQREALRRLKEERRRRRMRQLNSPNNGGGGGDEDDSSMSPTATPTAATVFLKRLVPSCLARRATLSHLRDEEDSSLSHLDLVDEELGTVHRSVMAKTRQKYLAMEAASFWDRSFTAGLIFLTMIAILVLFLYQNFGPGILTDHKY